MKLDQITNKAKLEGSVNPNDEFYTPEYAILPILKYLKDKSTILCPFDTEQSNFVKIFRKEGHTVIASHIEESVDFFNITRQSIENVDYIISNPPYSLKAEVFQKLFELEKPFGMLVGVVGLFESKKRFDMFKNNKFEIMYFDKRVSYFKDYTDPKPSLNPPFSSVYITSKILPQQIIFENVIKK